MRRLPALLLALPLVAAAGFAACDGRAPPPTQVPSLSYDRFVAEVEPLLVQGCAFPACHGNENRPMRVFGPGRHRWSAGLPSDGFAEVEHQANFDRVRVFAAPTSAPLPDLLRKPLERSAGGAEHGGVDRYGRNVYPDQDDPRWQALLSWARGDGWDGGSADGGRDDGGAAGDGGPSCAPCGLGYELTVKPIVNPTRCGPCHAGQDAGCAYRTETLQDLLGGGCDAIPNVKACDALRSKLARYADLLHHQGKFDDAQGKAISAWINCGALP